MVNAPVRPGGGGARGVAVEGGRDGLHEGPMAAFPPRCERVPRPMPARLVGRVDGTAPVHEELRGFRGDADLGR